MKLLQGVRYEEIYLEYTPTLVKDVMENKTGVLDVRVIANKTNDIDLEMQVAKTDYMAERILWYWAKMYQSSVGKGESYSVSKRAICILIADFNLNNLSLIEKYHTKWNIREEEYKEIVLTDRLELHIIELRKLE